MKLAWIVGANGQLGRALQAQLGARGLALKREGLALDNPEVIGAYLDAIERQEGAPSLVINASAYNKVDQAETDKEACLRLNCDVPAALARWCAERGATFFHYSTDFVFDGLGERPWEETDQPSPLSVYGESKWRGEQAVLEENSQALVFRTSWVFSAARENFVLSICKNALVNSQLKVVADQIGSPTFASHLARMSLEIATDPRVLEGGLGGIYHLANSGYVSRADFARAILSQAAVFDRRLENVAVEAIATVKSNGGARRPLNSRLSLAKIKSTFNVQPPSWNEGLVECLREVYLK